MLDDRLEDRLRATLRKAGDELELTIEPAELERRLVLRGRVRRTRQWTLLAAAIGIVAVGALVASTPSWFRQMPNQVASTASPRATIAPASASPLPSSTLRSTPAAEAPTPAATLSIRYRTRSGQAFEIAIDGTGRRRAPTYDLAPGAIEPGLPHGSSGDGRFIASADGDVVTVARADGELESHVAVPRLKGDEQTDFEWSPDGRFIAVWRSDDRRMNAPHYLWMVDLANHQTIAGPLRSIGRPSSTAWSPDSRLYAFGFWDGLKVLTAATGELKVYQKPGHDTGGYIGVAWSPDSRWIGFVPFEAGNGEIHRINADTTDHRRLGPGVEVIWSPDGSRIASTRRSDGPAGRGTLFEIWTMAPDGSDQRVLVTKQCPCGDPTWSPDGKWVTFSTSPWTNDEVWVVSADGGAPRRLARHALFVEWVSP